MVSKMRLNQELKDMKKNPVSGIDVFLPSDSNIYLWHANLTAPSNSPYAGKTLTLRIIISYPNEPPETIQFLEPIPYHLNVSQTDGQVCLGATNPAKWEPVSSDIMHILVAIKAALAEPQEDSYVDDDVYSVFNKDNSLYLKKAKESVES